MYSDSECLIGFLKCSFSDRELIILSSTKIKNLNICLETESYKPILLHQTEEDRTHTCLDGLALQPVLSALLFG